MRFPSFSAVATATATLLIATGPSLAAALARGPRYQYPRRIDMTHPRRGSPVTFGSINLPPSTTSAEGAAATGSPPGSTVPGESFQLNILNRQKPDKDLWVYIQGLDASGRPGFLVPPPGGKPSEVATWFMPDGPAPEYTADNNTIVKPAPIASEKIAIKLPKNTGGDAGGTPPTHSIMLPGYIESGRVYLSEEELVFSSYKDPHNPNNIMINHPSVLEGPAMKINFGFIELTWCPKKKGLYANLSFVDWVGMVLGMSVREHGETNEVKGKVPGLKGSKDEVLRNICSGLAEAAKKGEKFAWWNNLCIRDQTQNPLRVLSPNLFLSKPGVEQSGFYDDYINQVWAKYTQTPLKVDTQVWAAPAPAAAVAGGTATASSPSPSGGPGWTVGENRTGAICECKTDEATGAMKCGGKDCLALSAGDAAALTFPRPTDRDIFSCNSGAFAHKDSNTAYAQLRPRLCAGFVRSTLLLDDTTPSVNVRQDKYYKDEIHDYYSQIVHENLEGNLGYTFSFDDVNPGLDNSAGVIEMRSPEVMNIVAGGWRDGDELFVTK